MRSSDKDILTVEIFENPVGKLIEYAGVMPKTIDTTKNIFVASLETPSITMR